MAPQPNNLVKEKNNHKKTFSGQLSIWVKIHLGTTKNKNYFHMGEWYIEVVWHLVRRYIYKVSLPVDTRDKIVSLTDQRNNVNTTAFVPAGDGRIGSVDKKDKETN